MSPISYSVEIEGQNKIQRALAQLESPVLEKTARKALLRCGLLVQRQAADIEIAGGGNLGRGRQTSVLPGRLTSRSGFLRSKIRVNRGPSFVDIGTDVKYGRAHELGVKKTVPVKAHTRRRYGGRLTRLSKSGKFVKTKKRRTIGSIKVKAHRRKMNLEARPFLKPALVKKAPEFTGIYIEEIDKAMPR